MLLVISSWLFASPQDLECPCDVSGLVPLPGDTVQLPGGSPHTAEGQPGEQPGGWPRGGRVRNTTVRSLLSH